MVHGAADADAGERGAGADEAGLIAPRRLANPCLESANHLDLHRELMFNQRIGKSVLNQKSELQKALTKLKEKQIMNQEKEHKEQPELERAIAERAKRAAALANGLNGETAESDPATYPQYAEARARLRAANAK